MYEIYKSLYDDEIRRKENLNDKLSGAVLLISLYVTGTGICLKEMLDYSYPKWIEVATLAIVLISLVIFAQCAIAAFKSIFGYEYAYPTPKKLANRHFQLKIYHERNYTTFFSGSGKSINQLIELDMKEGLSDNYKDALIKAFDNNNAKSKLWGRFYLLVFIALLLIASDLLIIYISRLFMKGG